MYNTVNFKTNDRAFGRNILILQLTECRWHSD